MFKNKNHAGSLLVPLLEDLHLQNPLVIGIPRGGVEVASPIARGIQAPLYVIIPRKIGAPFNPEYAVGAVAPDGTVSYDETLLNYLGLIPQDMEKVIQREKQEIAKRTHLYGKWGTLPDLKNYMVILVDDGIATGYTVKAALSSLRKQTTNPIILAVPVLPEDVVSSFESLVDKLIYLHAPIDFRAVGQFYEDFSEISHEAVLNILEETNKKVTCHE
jgi:predicted phosphoribosyltransferase